MALSGSAASAVAQRYRRRKKCVSRVQLSAVSSGRAMPQLHTQLVSDGFTLGHTLVSRSSPFDVSRAKGHFCAISAAACSPGRRVATLVMRSWNVALTVALGVLLLSRESRGWGRMRTLRTPMRMAMSGQEVELPILPFPAKDCVLPGETKRVHLYEARFLALFEYALQRQGGEIAVALVLRSGISQVLTVCEVLEWERKDIGVGVTLLATHRAKLTKILKEEPYLVAAAEVFADDRDSEMLIAEASASAAGFDRTTGEETAEESQRVAALRDLASEVNRLAEACEGFEERLRRAKTLTDPPIDGEDDELWGHSTRAEGTTLAQRMSEAIKLLYPVSGASEGERLRVLSFLAAASVDTGLVQAEILQSRDINERFRRTKQELEEKQKFLAAKATLLSLSFDP